jgi:hypothetical protein
MPKTPHIVEQQMRFQQVLARVAEQKREEPSLGPFITLSRQPLSQGGDIARLVGSRLSWNVLDRELVEGLAERLELSPEMLDLMDEKDSNWFRETVLNLLDSRIGIQHSYLSKLGKVMLLAACQGKVVIVGRGGNFLLPSARGLRVLVVAARPARVASLCRREGVDERAADKRLEELDSHRVEFIRRNFNQEPDDPNHYDLVLDSSAFGLEAGADLICRALETLHRVRTTS